MDDRQTQEHCHGVARWTLAGDRAASPSYPMGRDTTAERMFRRGHAPRAG